MSSKIIESVAYSYIGRFIEPYLAEFDGLKLTLRKAGVDKSVRMYLSVRIFWAIILSIVSLDFFPKIFLIQCGVQGLMIFFSSKKR